MFAGYAFAEQPFAASVGFYYTAFTADTATAADQTAALPTYSTQAQESAAGQDAATSTSVFTALAQDTATGSDQAVSSSFFGSVVLEAASLADTAAALITFLANTAETATALDAALARINFLVTAAESVAALDAAQTNTVFRATVSETVFALDATSFRYLWEPINDDQSPGWTDVLPSITIAEVATFAGGTFGGFPFAGTYSRTFSPYITVWVEINNDQPPGAPGWANIDAPS